MYYFDNYGWHTDTPINGRDTDIPPPIATATHKANWTGFAWVLTPYTAPPVQTVVPDSISPRQLRQALSRVGLRDAVESAVAVSDQDTKDWYEWATVFERNHPRVIGMGVALGQSYSQLDELFILGGSL